MTNLDTAISTGIAPWSNSQIVFEHADYVIYRDGFPVAEGHLLFVPRTSSLDNIQRCLAEAYAYGYNHYPDFNVGINHGVHAGQSVMYPHIHLIPRILGDTPSPRGGVRHVIAGKGNYIDTRATIQLI